MLVDKEEGRRGNSWRITSFFSVKYEARGTGAMGGLRRNEKVRKSCTGVWDSELIWEVQQDCLVAVKSQFLASLTCFKCQLKSYLLQEAFSNPS